MGAEQQKAAAFTHLMAVKALLRRLRVLTSALMLLAALPACGESYVYVKFRMPDGLTYEDLRLRLITTVDGVLIDDRNQRIEGPLRSNLQPHGVDVMARSGRHTELVAIAYAPTPLDPRGPILVKAEGRLMIAAGSGEQILQLELCLTPVWSSAAEVSCRTGGGQTDGGLDMSADSESAPEASAADAAASDALVDVPARDPGVPDAWSPPACQMPKDPDATVTNLPAISVPEGCPEYCTAMMARCPWVFETSVRCLYVCAKLDWPKGVPGDFGDTLACRTQQAQKTPMESWEVLHLCQTASPDSHGQCGRTCDVYCRTGAQICPGQFPPEHVCVEACRRLQNEILAADPTMNVAAAESNLRTVLVCRNEELYKAIFNTELCSWAAPLNRCRDPRSRGCDPFP